MNNSQGALYFGAGIDMTQWRNSINEMRQDIFGLNNTVQKETKNIDSAFKNLSLGIAGYFSGQALLGFAKELINIRGEFQKTEIAFSTMLGDANQAKSLMGDMVNLAAKTPFSLQDVSSGAKQLLAFQIPASQVVDTLTRMGNIAAGLSIPLSRINLVYGQVKAKGKLMGDDLRQFTEAGIPMVAELAKKFNKTTAEVSAMVSAGKIGFKDVKDVLFSLTNEGGMFFNLMEKQSASLSGKISNLEDAWDQMLNKIGEANEGLLNDAIDGLSYLVENYEEVIKVLKVLIITYGAYRAALILTAVVQKAQAMYQSITTWISLARSIKTAADAQALFNLTTKANPLVAAITIIALVTSTYAVYGDQLKELLSITIEFNATQIAKTEITDKYQKEFSKGVAKSKADIDLLIHTIKNENTSLEGRKKAYEKLIAIDPAFRGTLDAQFKATNRLASTFDYVTKKMQEFAKAQARMAVTRANLEKEAQSEMDYQKAEYDYQKALEKSSKAPVNRLGGDNSGIKYRQEAIEAKKLRDEKLKEFKENKELNNYILKSNDEITAQIRKNISVADKQIKTGMVEGKKASKETIEWVKQLKKTEEDKLKIFVPVEIGDDEVKTGGVSGWKAKLDERIKSLGEAIDNAPTKALARKLTLQKEALERERDSINSKNTTQKQLAEIFPEGSIKDLERRAQLLEEALQTMQNGMVKLRKLDKFGHDKDKNGNPYYTGQTVTKDEAKKQLQDINNALEEKRREIQVKSFDEEMTETERQWNVRYQLATKYGEEVAKAQFPNLKGVSYFDEIEKRIREFEEKSSNGFKLTDKELQNWAKLNDIFRNLTGEKDPKTQFTDDLEAKLYKMSTQAEKVVYLQREYDKIVSQESTKNSNRRGQGFEAIINQRLEAEKKLQKDNYVNLLKEHRSFEEKKEDITREFQANMTFAKNDSEKEKIRKAYNEQFSAITVEAFRNSKDWETAFGEMEFASKSTLERILQQLINFRQANKDNLSVQDYKIVSDKITEIQNRLYQFDPLKGLVSSYKNYRSDAEKLLKFLSDLEQANVDLADSYDLLNKAQSSEEFEAAMRKHDAALEKRRRATEGVKQAEDQFSNSQKKLISAINSTADKLKYAQEIIGSLKGIFDDLGISMDNAFGDVVSKVEQTLQGLEQVAGGLTKALSGIASGNIFQAVAGGIQAIGGLIKSISGWFNNDKKKERAIKREAEALKELKSAYEDLAYAANKALGTDKYDAEKRSLQNIRDQQARLREMYRIEGDKKKSDSGKMDEYKEQIKSLDRQYQDLVDSIAKDFLQTDAKDMASQLTDGLVEALSKGESALDSLDKKANDVFANMAKAWVRSRLEKSMGDIFDKMLAESGVNKDGTGTFNPLSSDRMNYYKELMKNAGLEQQKFLEQYKEFFQDANSSPKGLEGAIKGVSEETASLIAGQMNAIRINQGKMLELQDKSSAVMRESLIQLSKIEFNTSRLHNIDKNMAELNSKITNNNGLRGIGL
ncbi:tape measure protein [Elizabethkingia anophelis]|nr:tape measure protein [Elizabethkingia anophelis]MCT4170308.1 tape measure protein [Elizabethkingia anophelis]MCT4244792.1 tape measure protein [Elizabethkingia anophelis]MCT4248458.1 tape measure protein [Elizabethkingia anophelis]MCT4259448.1 tape measure protein [Elizabethkingia anophelis]